MNFQSFEIRKRVYLLNKGVVFGKLGREKEQSFEARSAGKSKTAFLEDDLILLSELPT